jgi:putative hydrolase of the HAD superfamily
MPPLKNIFFDVGHTLLGPNYDITLAPLYERGIRPTPEQMRATELRTRRQLDDLHAQGRVPTMDANYASFYFTDLLSQFQVTDEALKQELMRRSRRALNYTRVLPAARETLARFQGRYQMAIISNADGTIAELLRGLEMAGYFASITDSGVCGHEKPAPEIFEQALASVGARPEESLYVGDVYSVDYVGATNVGMSAVIIDALGVYSEMAVPRVERLDQLEALLVPPA